MLETFVLFTLIKCDDKIHEVEINKIVQVTTDTPDKIIMGLTAQGVRIDRGMHPKLDIDKYHLDKNSVIILDANTKDPILKLEKQIAMP